MSSSGLFSELKKHPWIMVLVILIHIGLVVLLSINLSNDEKPPMPMAQKHKIIDAVTVDAKKYDEREKQKKIAIRKKQEAKKVAEKKSLAETSENLQKKENETTSNFFTCIISNFCPDHFIQPVYRNQSYRSNCKHFAGRILLFTSANSFEN